MSENYELLLSTNTPKKNTIIILNIFWIGFIVYVASFTISAPGQANYIISNMFQIIGLLMFIPTAVLLVRFKSESNYLNIIFFIYCIWLLSVMVRGIKLDYDNFKFVLFSAEYGFLIYVVPMVLLFPKNIHFYKKAFDIIVILGIIYIIFSIFFIRDILARFDESLAGHYTVEYFSKQLSLPCGFILMTFIYNSKKRNLFALFIVFLTFLLAVIRARRGLMFMSFSMLVFSYFIYQFANKTKLVNFIMSLFIAAILSYIGVKIYNENRKDTFGLITERIGDNSRSLVEQYFYNDMRSKDWVIGKGINGEYYAPGVPEGGGQISIYRRVIETGYLQVILKGGIVSLGLFLLIAFPAMVKGFFSSNNLLSKAAAVWIFLFLTFMYPGTPTHFSLHHILFWLSVGICYSSEIRSIPDDKIKEIFSEYKSII